MRATLRASSSRSDALAPRRPRKEAIDSALFHVTTPEPRRMRQEAGRPTSPRRAASSGASSARDHELEMGPTRREAQRPAGEEPAAQPGGPAVLGRRRPVQVDFGEQECPAGRSPTLARVTAEADDQARDRGLPSVDPRAKTCDLGLPIAGARRVDGGHLRAQRSHEVPIGAGHQPGVRTRGPRGRRPDAAGGPAPAPRPRGRRRPGAPGRGGGRSPDRRGRRGPGVARLAPSMQAASAAGPARRASPREARASRRLLASTMSGSCAAP